MPALLCTASMRPNLLQYRTDGGAHCLAIRHIGMEGDAVAARHPMRCAGRIQITVENGDRGSFARIGKSALAADAIGTAGQYNDFA